MIGNERLPIVADHDEARSTRYEPQPGHRNQVEAMAGYGIPESDIATVLDIGPDTLRLHYRRELEASGVKTNAKVAENLYRKATGDGREAVIAAIFWLKTRARWKETSVHELGGSDGEPIHIQRIERVIINPRDYLADRDRETTSGDAGS